MAYALTKQAQPCHNPYACDEKRTKEYITLHLSNLQYSQQVPPRARSIEKQELYFFISFFAKMT